jgi:Tol biopolymer transport system component
LDGSSPELCYVEPGTRNIETLTNDRAPKRDPAWSSDGTRLAFVIGGGPGDGNIMSWNFWRHMECPEGGGPCRTFGPRRLVATGFEPAWSPDGGQIAFVSRRSGNADLYVVRDVGGAPRRLTTNAADDTQPSWSPNGRTIAFARGGTIRLVNVNGSGDRPLGAGSNPAWAPNGARLAFELGGDIWTANASGGARTNLTNTPTTVETGPSWSADGAALTFAARSDNGTEALGMHVGGRLQSFEVSGDQQRPFVQASVDWQPIRVLVARVSNRKPVVSITDASGKPVRSLRAGLYVLAKVDRSARHGIMVVASRGAPRGRELGGTATFAVGRFWPSLTASRLSSIPAGLVRFFCPAHRSERGSFRVFERA